MIRKIYCLTLNASRLHTVTKRRFGVDVNVEKHERFLRNFDRNLRETDVTETSSCVVDAVKGGPKAQKERFHSYPVDENDMYSNKPVWQQLNEIENAWKVKFKYKSRIETQKKISKAKKGTETLGELEANKTRLLEIDAFRPKQVDVKEPETDAKPVEAKPAAFLATDESTSLVNDLKLGGDCYYEKVDLSKTEESNAGPPSIKPETMLSPNDRELLTEIFGKGDDAYVDATRPSAIIEATTNLEPETWLNMDPNHILIQQDLLKAKSPTQVLMAIGDKLKQMNAVNVSTAVHRLAKHINPYNRFTVCNHDTFGQLIAVAEEHITRFDPQGLTNMLWSLVRLKITPKWLDCLLEQINVHANSLNVSELANCLFCLSKLTRANDASLELRFKILSMVQDKITQFRRPLDLTCVATALARLNVRNPVIFGHISSQVIAAMNEFKTQELCGVAWAYASLGFTDHLLFAKIRQFIEAHADANNIGNIVHLAWALSKLKEADPDFFLYTVSPLVRSHLASISCKHITTVAWAFVNAGIEDEELFNDIAATLLHHVDDMTTHDVASTVVAFSHFEEHKQLLKKIKARAALMLNEFTPLQLAKIVAGFAGLADQGFYNQLAKVVDAKLHLMSPENIVEILSGFAGANVLPIPLFTKLLNTVAKSCKKMYAEDSLLLLQLLERLRGSSVSPQLSKLLGNLAQNLIEHINERVARWRCFDVAQITTLFNCLSLGDGTSNVVATVAKQLVSCLNRVYKSNIAADAKRQIFADFVLSTTRLPPNALATLKTKLAQDPQLIKAFNNFVALVKPGPDETPFADVLNVLHACTALGFYDHVTAALFDQLVEHEDEWLSLSDAESLSKLVWSLTEANAHANWAIEKVRELAGTHQFEPTQTDLDSLVRLMWACAVLSEDELLLELAQHVPKYANLFPTDVLSAQQVALHVLKCLDADAVFARNPLLESRDSEADSGATGPQTVTPAQKAVLSEWLDYQREDLYARNRRDKNMAVELDHDSLISDCLVKVSGVQCSDENTAPHVPRGRKHLPHQRLVPGREPAAGRDRVHGKAR